MPWPVRQYGGEQAEARARRPGRGRARPGPGCAAGAVRYAQVEITTHCNFSCFYCAGRAMPQRHMNAQLFDQVLERLPEYPITVSLQGEGEPLLHPMFWVFVAAVRARGHQPYTITNGTAVAHPQRLAEAFPSLGISIDTLNPDLAIRIGRTQPARVLRNLDRLIAHMDPLRVVVHTVDFGQPLAALREFTSRRGLRHLVQPLQRKEDYRRHYPDKVAANGANASARCSYISTGYMRYFNIDGAEMPCCFIKDAGKYRGLNWIHEEFRNRRVPACCAGCGELTRVPRSNLNAGNQNSCISVVNERGMQ